MLYICRTLAGILAWGKNNNHAQDWQLLPVSPRALQLTLRRYLIEDMRSRCIRATSLPRNDQRLNAQTALG